jgi:hypothetical protein
MRDAGTVAVPPALRMGKPPTTPERDNSRLFSRTEDESSEGDADEKLGIGVDFPVKVCDNLQKSY